MTMPEKGTLLHVGEQCHVGFLTSLGSEPSDEGLAFRQINREDCLYD